MKLVGLTTIGLLLVVLVAAPSLALAGGKAAKARKARAAKPVVIAPVKAEAPAAAVAPDTPAVAVEIAATSTTTATATATATPTTTPSPTLAAPAEAALAPPVASEGDVPPLPAGFTAGNDEVRGERSITDELGLGTMIGPTRGSAAVKLRPGAAAAAPVVDARVGAFDLGRKDRRAAVPKGDAQLRVDTSTLSTTAVATVVRARLAEVEYCWARLPKAQRVAATVVLRLTIEPRGVVSAAEVVGGVTATRMARCARDRVLRWTFPTADGPTEVDYPLSFGSTD